MSPNLIRLLVIGSALMFGSVVFGQTPRPGSNTIVDPSPVTVTLPVSVRNGKKGFVTDLTYRDFEVVTGKTNHPVEFFAPPDQPFSLAVLIDFSGSATGDGKSGASRLKMIADGFRSFLAKANPNNEYFFIGFAGKPLELLGPTRDRAKIEKFLDVLPAIGPDGNTNLYRAIELGYEKLMHGSHSQHALVVISDGIDNGTDEKSYDRVVELVRENEWIPLYQINVGPNSPIALQMPMAKPGDLETMAALRRFESVVNSTTGRSFELKDARATREGFNELGEELRSLYFIGLRPDPAAGSKKSWHESKVTLKLSDERRRELGKIVVRAPKGFMY